MHTADWYFDVISPFAYLQLVRFDRLPDDLAITCRPILFAGLLGHWGQKGPAEIAAKRLHTYRFSQWRADREGVPLRYPPVHPFNPLKALRLCIARGSDVATVRAVFDHIWRDGIGIDSEAGWRALAERLGIDDADALVSAQEVKDGVASLDRGGHRRGRLRGPDVSHWHRALLGRRRDRNDARLPRRSEPVRDRESTSG